MRRGGGGGGEGDRPTFHAQTGCLRVGAAFFPDVNVAGYDSATFLGIETASYEWDDVACDCIKDVECVSC